MLQPYIESVHSLVNASTVYVLVWTALVVKCMCSIKSNCCIEGSFSSKIMLCSL